jgi:hypothetical protein
MGIYFIHDGSASRTAIFGKQDNGRTNKCD